MARQLDMLPPSLAPLRSVLSQGSVVNRSAIARSSARKNSHASVTCMHDSDVERVVTEIRLYECSAYLETRTLFDFDKQRNRWATEGTTRREDVTDPKQAVRIARAMVEQLDALPHRHAQGGTEMYNI